MVIPAADFPTLCFFCTMNSPLQPAVSQPCPCEHRHLIPRRKFLRSFLPGVMLRAAVATGIVFPSPLTAQPARASEHKAKAFVLSCIDFRVVEAERAFLSLQHLGNQYDWMALAGASLALTGFPHTAEADTFWDQLALSRQLHHIEKVILFDHQDCGAYASKIDPNLSQDRQREQQIHADYLNRAYREIQKQYPELTVEFILLR